MGWLAVTLYLKVFTLGGEHLKELLPSGFAAIGFVVWTVWFTWRVGWKLSKRIPDNSFGNEIVVIPDKYRKKLEGERKELEQDIEAEVDSE